ncbi:cytochrome c oxidase accessory protein CcoG [bacterium]|nr:cytochrome c oxidase accessory protein CcoG [bacterium]
MFIPGHGVTAARRKVYPRNSPGRFRSLRNAISLVLQAGLFALPWLNWHSRQAVLADLPGRKLFLFGLVLHPQDNYFLLLLTVIAVVLISAVSTLAGRIWCGFACPQTIFTQAFIAVERFFEGDRAARVRLDRSPWNFQKLRLKISKWAVWSLMGFWLGVSFSGYFLPVRELTGQILAGQVSPSTGLVVLSFTGLALFDFGYFREQFCQHICPYARLQGTMLDSDSIIVGYDSRRGEPRAKLKAPERGSCVDCTMCVQVCPAGIDIRDGLQSECIGCTACIDACDDIMDKLKQPRGLIRFTSLNELEGRATRLTRPRLLIYMLSLAVLSILFVYLVVFRPALAFDCERVVQPGGQLASLTADGRVSNIFKVHLANQVADPIQVRLQLAHLEAELMGRSTELTLAPGEVSELQLLLVAQPGLKRGIHPFQFCVLLADGSRLTAPATFFVP